jgi:hypothetical protein
VLIVIPAQFIVIKGPDPDVLVFIFYDIVNAAIVDAPVVFRIIHIGFKSIAIIPAQTIPGTKPHKAILVFDYSMDSILSQAILRGYVYKLQI